MIVLLTNKFSPIFLHVGFLRETSLFHSWLQNLHLGIRVPCLQRRERVTQVAPTKGSRPQITRDWMKFRRQPCGDSRRKAPRSRVLALPQESRTGDAQATPNSSALGLLTVAWRKGSRPGLRTPKRGPSSKVGEVIWRKPLYLLFA